MSKGQLEDYIDTLLSDISGALTEYRRTRNNISVFSMKDAAFCLALVCDQFSSRLND